MMLTSWKESYDQPRQCIKKQRHYIANKGPYGQGYGFSSSHVWMWELDYKESWELKNWCFWTVVLEKTLESPLDCKEIQPVHLKADQSCMFIGRTDVEAETPILWPPYSKSWLIGKDPDAGRDWGQEEKRMTEDEMVGCHHWINGHEFGWTLGTGDGQGVLACCLLRGHRESETTEQLNWTELKGVVDFKVVRYLIFCWLYIFVFIPRYPIHFFLLLMAFLCHCILWVAIKLFTELFKNSHTSSDHLHSTLVLILIIF